MIIGKKYLDAYEHLLKDFVNEVAYPYLRYLVQKFEEETRDLCELIYSLSRKEVEMIKLVKDRIYKLDNFYFDIVYRAWDILEDQANYLFNAFIQTNVENIGGERIGGILNSFRNQLKIYRNNCISEIEYEYDRINKELNKVKSLKYNRSISSKGYKRLLDRRFKLQDPTSLDLNALREIIDKWALEEAKYDL